MTLDQITKVVSHPHANAQCRIWLRRNLPGREVEAANSTANAVEKVASASEPWAAIGNRLAGEKYGCAILEADIEDHDDNETRFVFLARQRERQDWFEPYKTSVVCEIAKDQPGALLLDPAGVRLPSHQPHQDRVAAVEAQAGRLHLHRGHGGQGRRRAHRRRPALLRCKLPRLTVLGSYPVGRPLNQGDETWTTTRSGRGASMLDIKLIRNDPDPVREALQPSRRPRRGGPGQAARAGPLAPRDPGGGRGAAQACGTSVSEEIARLKRDKQDAAGKIEAMREVGDEIKRLEAELKEVEAALEEELLQVPNLPDPTAPDGGEEDSVVLHHWGAPAGVRLRARWTTSTWRRRTTSSTWSAAPAPRAAASPISRATWCSCSSPWCSSPCRSWPPRASGR